MNWSYDNFIMYVIR